MTVSEAVRRINAFRRRNLGKYPARLEVTDTEFYMLRQEIKAMKYVDANDSKEVNSLLPMRIMGVPVEAVSAWNTHEAVS